jgi:putative CocE/NonD family hydrolase
VGRDGYDVVEWIAKQPWSDGHVVMYSGSFVGMTQWRTAAQLPPHLSGIAPFVPICRSIRDGMYRTRTEYRRRGPR